MLRYIASMGDDACTNHFRNICLPVAAAVI